jgi:hypothetical protein
MSNVVYMASPRLCAAADLRADGGIRKISLEQGCVRIDRVMAGVKMRLAVPVDSYRGVVLSSEERGGQTRYRVTLAHRDAELAILLHDGAEWGDVLPIWQRWAQFFGRPALFHDGSAAADSETASVKAARPRRPAARLAKRRARRMWRSRQVRLGPPANVLIGARELISYE